MATCRDIATYRFTNSDRIFFDANVWLSIYGPQGDPRDPVARTYSAALSRILNGGLNVHVDALVLSEFANRYARLEFELRKQYGVFDKFKPFRDSDDYIDVAAGIADAMRRILAK